FESKDVQFQPKESVKEVAQLSLFEEATVVEEIASSVTTDASTDEEKLVIEKLEKLNIMGTSPIQAMNILYELQQMLLNKK
ncbi:hypothetical protein D7X33_28535, partial [Butyricicoccus sp. 1XD8-22]